MTALEYLEKMKPEHDYADGLHFKVTQISARPDVFEGNFRPDARHWRFTFTYRPKSGASPRKFTGFYTQGSGHKDPPKAYEVLECLVMDANCPDTFDEWCSEYGYDTDSRKAYNIWQKCRETRKRLTHLLGSIPDIDPL